MKSKNALDWLLEEDQPSVRYLALTQLLKRPLDDPEVVAAKDMITRKGWAEEILANRDPAGWWVSGESLYRPKYLSANWMLLILADLGLTRADPRIERACDLWIERFAREDGGFAMEGSKKGHLCTTGNATRALVQFGYGDHPAVGGAGVRGRSAIAIRPESSAGEEAARWEVEPRRAPSGRRGRRR